MDWGKVGSDMITAAKDSAGADWPTLRDYAVDEFKTLSDIAGRIDNRIKNGTISEVNAQYLMGQYLAASRAVVFAIEDLTNIVIQNAWNAAVKVLATAINKATGWALL